MKSLIPTVLLVAAVTGCSAGTANEEARQDSAAPATSAAEGPNSIASASPAPNSADPLTVSFAELSSNIPGEVGVAIAGGDGVRVFGQWAGGPAWSTIKVPLAMAALRQSNASTTSLVARAIEQSDNAAAMEIWGQLGDPKVAAGAVQGILREGGDTVTVVQSERIRPEFTPFGQTMWSMAAQAQFAATLPCLPASEAVLEDMRNLAVDQRWGLATRADTATKGGWGPSPDGSYLVRQLGIISTPSGTLGFSLSAAPADGQFDSGVAHLGRLAEWVGAHLEGLRGRTCQ